MYSMEKDLSSVRDKIRLASKIGLRRIVGTDLVRKSKTAWYSTLKGLNPLRSSYFNILMYGTVQYVRTVNIWVSFLLLYSTVCKNREHMTSFLLLYSMQEPWTYDVFSFTVQYCTQEPWTYDNFSFTVQYARTVNIWHLFFYCTVCKNREHMTSFLLLYSMQEPWTYNVFSFTIQYTRTVNI